MSSLYKSDYPAWVQQQLEALKNRNFEALDIDNLIDEIEDLGSWYEDLIHDNLKALFALLLVWEYVPYKRNGNWAANIQIRYDNIKDLVDESPTMKAKLPELIEDAYNRCFVFAEVLSEWSKTMYDFPKRCLWEWEDLEVVVENVAWINNEKEEDPPVNKIPPPTKGKHIRFEGL